MRVSVLPSPWDEFSVASRAYPGEKRGQKMLCFVGRGDINITDRSAATWHPATGNDVRGSGHFLSQQQSYTDLWFKGGRFQQRRAAIWAFLWPGGAHTEEFRSLPTGSSTGSSTTSNLHKFAFEYSRDTPLIEMLLMTLKRSWINWELIVILAKMSSFFSHGYGVIILPEP